MTRVPPRQARLSPLARVLTALVVFLVVAGAIVATPSWRWGSVVSANSTEPTKSSPGKFYPTTAQWASIGVDTVEARIFLKEHLTEGKIGVDEDHSTPIYSLYAGRIAKLLVNPGQVVQRGQPLFVLEAADALQAQNDFIAALTGVNKARSQVRLAEIVEQRMRGLYDAKAMPLKDLQQAETDLSIAQNDLRTAQTALEAMRNRLRMLGKTDAQIDAFQQTGAISAETVVFAPLAGTVVLRKAGPGQYIGASTSDPVFVIGDLSTVWLIAYVRESEAPRVKDGQPVKFRVLAYPDRVFEAKLNYVSTAIEPSTRRLLVRATIDNPDGILKPEMFASVTIVTKEDTVATPAVPVEAVIREGDTARVWVATNDSALEMRWIKLGLSAGRLLQVLDGLAAGEKVVTRGGLFVDRAATGS